MCLFSIHVSFLGRYLNLYPSLQNELFLFLIAGEQCGFDGTWTVVKMLGNGGGGGSCGAEGGQEVKEGSRE